MFEVNTWIRNNTYPHLRPMKIARRSFDNENWNKELDYNVYYSYGLAWKTTDDIELWKPKEAEWCWDTKHMCLVQITYKEITLYDTSGYTVASGWKHELKFSDLEPYIGDLPSFLKG